MSDDDLPKSADHLSVNDDDGETSNAMEAPDDAIHDNHQHVSKRVRPGDEEIEPEGTDAVPLWKTTRAGVEAARAAGFIVRMGRWTRKETQLLRQRIIKFRDDNNLSNRNLFHLVHPSHATDARGKDFKYLRQAFYANVRAGIRRGRMYIYLKIRGLISHRRWETQRGLSPEQRAHIVRLYKVCTSTWGQGG